MRRVAIACVLAAVTLAAVADAPEAARPPVASAQIQLGETADGACRGRTTQFILDHVRDLHVCVVYRNVAGLLVQRLKFTGPDGNVYHVLGAPFATPGVAVPAQGVDVDGILRPVKRTQRVVADGLSVRDGRVLWRARDGASRSAAASGSSPPSCFARSTAASIGPTM